MATRKKAPTPTELAAERKRVTDEIKVLTDRKAQLDEALLALDLDETYEGDGVALSFTPVRGLDTAFITRKFPASKYPDFYKLTFDTAEFRKNFSAKEISAFEKLTYRIKIEEA